MPGVVRLRAFNFLWADTLANITKSDVVIGKIHWP